MTKHFLAIVAILTMSVISIVVMSVSSQASDRSGSDPMGQFLGCTHSLEECLDSCDGDAMPVNDPETCRPEIFEQSIACYCNGELAE